MGLVYQQANTVYAWLGEEADNSAEAMALLQILQLVLFGENPDQIQQLKAGRFLSGWRAVISLLRRPYWTRAWIVQEILLAKNVMLCCGKHKVAWPPFAMLVSYIIPQWHTEAVASREGSEHGPFNETLWSLQYLIHDIGHLSRLSIKYQNLLSNNEPTTSPGSCLDILDCLTMCRWRSAKDKRDYVHSMLSLANAKHIEPNYEKPTEWLFCKVAVMDIQTRGTLDILSGCKHFDEEERNLDAFTSVMKDQLLQNNLLSQDVTGSSSALPASVKSLDIGEHPVWFERSSQFLQANYELLTSIAREIGAEGSRGGEHGVRSHVWSLEVLSSLLANIRDFDKKENSFGTLARVKDFKAILQRFLKCHREITECRLLNASLPTWVPNWTLPLLSPLQNILLHDGSRELYHAAGGTTPNVSVDEDGRVLTVEGVLVDKVAHVPQIDVDDPLQDYWDAYIQGLMNGEVFEQPDYGGRVRRKFGIV
ncbi:hypothetical protein DL770_011906 [Monosporascus sp. CRB-9-2]|nr:hypothetical protein DL770_011906 [Monosporascus sp. CRB-9-2]